VAYHDEEWGVPVRDDRRLFEKLILEGAQAGLSWITILRKRPAYRKAYQGFEPVKVAAMTDAELEAVLLDPGVVRNRLKVFAARRNAQAFLKVQAEFGTFSAYLWAFVGNRTLDQHPKTLKDVPTTSPEAVALSRDLKKRGFTFVGPTCIYAYLQSMGLVNDHVADCWVRRGAKVAAKAAAR
jgi:DNA-3-methyladenine glycosylase I